MMNWKRLSGKLLVFLIGSTCLTFVLLTRLIDIQLYQGSEFRVKADENRFYSLSVPAERGVFLDRFQQPLVWNTRRYYQVADTPQLHQTRIPIDRTQALSLMATNSGSVVATLERTYRLPSALSHVLGFVGAVTPEDVANKAQVSLQEQLGRLGLELTHQSILRGVAGKDRYEINALGQRQKKVEAIPTTPGQNIPTTLDPYLSAVAYEAMEGKKGAVVIMDAKTGEILSLVSSPTFDANVLTRVETDPAAAQARKEKIQSYFSDPRQLFFNRAIDGAYPPGSVFKPITALAALEQGSIDASTIVVDEGILKVGEYEYGNWYWRQYGRTEGPLDLVRAIARSNDIYFYKAAESVGPDKVANMARMFGLGEPTGIQLRPEASGLVPDPAWKEKRLGEQWFLGNTYHYGIGQGDLLVTPIQMAQATQALANNGVRCQPTLIKKKSVACTELGLKAENIELVLKGMVEACSTGGTAYPFFPFNETHRIPDATAKDDIAAGAAACKTGTAEFGAADENDHRKTHGWFIAIIGTDEKVLGVPADGEDSDSAGAETATASANVQLDPESAGAENHLSRDEWLQHIQQHGFPEKLVFAVVVEGDEEYKFREGSADAAPVVKKIIDWMEAR